ncbi:uncharacterized protein N0V89_008067 [Didymosphaeria variabile]|uniref:Uncharacterized protein n=1 Tax=Didymosphaeria variabile TaxID=1932322 RepID=A0A9W8XG25_9PLEO|nr:uncharacterized protein N0V89_008067 [Didymosphaeria variabile]KAJ4349452.1 hypothetical protein N0V89_008067 [Didymosphaeria variabile]
MPNSGERRRGRDQVDEAWAHTQGTPWPKPRLSKVESIENTSPSSSANAEAHDGLSVLPSIEQSSMFGEDEGLEDKENEEEILFVVEERNKRRRVSPHPSTSPTHAYGDPATPHADSSPQIASPVSHRFKVPGPRPNVPGIASTTVVDRRIHPRPHFILPHLSPSPTKSANPLPETFSPSRKNGKYVADGMASTLQSWVHETASIGYTANTSSTVVWGRDKEDGVKIKIEVLSVMGGRGCGGSEVECWPGGIIFLRGVTDASLYNVSRASSFTQVEGNHVGPTEVNIMLAGQGGARGKGGVRVREGGVVGVRAPIWDVHIGYGEQAEKWLVGVEWVVL